ncbi:hypothetical protein NGM10_14400 [Halorussus salilacus]|uniref:hypothetical protein n=1 Tax=Halorussus salilacus TaxID=2953750 RepID=UPI00209F1A99|nr:hypothetical protein [Halorussus salilacus]USZ67910.1 hypothetical protein NGM10_14400 [Halorussus salilacus]
MTSDGESGTVESELVGKAVLLGILVLWFGIAVITGIGRTWFLVAMLVVGGGYLILLVLRLVRAVERLAVAAERLAETRE